ncbi:MAG: nucleotidyltransferase domain-containing protein [Candidatus Kaelpia aquatica]|nr:nucleotidyltransferase domain-containing protein [Candidatus Kaelpia aquatica]
MSKHQDLLDELTREIVKADPDCGVVLQGSVADGCERQDSDIDVFVVCSTARPNMNDYIQGDNRGNMRAKGPIEGIIVDIGWEYCESLAGTIQKEGAAGWFMFSQGIITHDPQGLARRCQDAMRAWFEANPTIARAWGKQQRDVRSRKVNPSHPMEYPTFHDFFVHVRELQRQENTEPKDGRISSESAFSDALSS